MVWVTHFYNTSGLGYSLLHSSGLGYSLLHSSGLGYSLLHTSGLGYLIIMYFQQCKWFLINLLLAICILRYALLLDVLIDICFVLLCI